MSKDERAVLGFSSAIAAGLLTTILYNWYAAKKNPAQVGTIASTPHQKGGKEKTNPLTATAPGVTLGGIGKGKFSGEVGVSTSAAAPSATGLGSGLGSQPEGSPVQQANFLSASSPAEVAAANYAKIADNTRANPAKVARTNASNVYLSGGPDCGS
jgi:hypothetical protein